MLVENILMDLWKNFGALFFTRKKSGDKNKKVKARSFENNENILAK